jgi:hypothetical protein
MNNDSDTDGFVQALGRALSDIVGEVLAPVRLRRKALAVTGAFVVASATACSVGTSPQTAPSAPENPTPSQVAATSSTPSSSPKPSSTAVQKVNANYKKFDPNNFGDAIGIRSYLVLRR